MSRPPRRLARQLGRLLGAGEPPSQACMAADPRYARYAIGEWTYGAPAVLEWGEATTLRIGRFCSIADGVTILLGGEHRVDWVTTYPFSALFPEAKRFPGHPRSKGDVVIGHDVWIGLNATILSGVSIGNGAVVAAESVVAAPVAPYAIVAGNPARQRRLRFPEQQVRQLEQIAWWDWPIEKIKDAWPLLLSGKVAEFIERHRPR